MVCLRSADDQVLVYLPDRVIVGRFDHETTDSQWRVLSARTDRPNGTLRQTPD